MTYREILPKDLPALRAMQGEHPWTFGEDFLGGIVCVDEEDRPIRAMGAWSLAEVHMVGNGGRTPAHRLLMMEEMHRAMSEFLRRRGVGRAVTWMDRCRAFSRRLRDLGWLRSDIPSYHRFVEGVHRGE